MIIAVAMFIDGKVESLPKPNRHHDIIRKFPLPDHEHGEQGFIDDKYGFLSRKAALGLVQDEGQELRGQKLTAPGHGLFSEDLW